MAKKTELSNLTIHKLIKGVFTESKNLSIKKKVTAEPYIRPSMAPACALKMFIKIAKGIGEESTWEAEENLMMDYYTSIGTETHTILQRWFGRTFKLLGNWSCLCKGTKMVKVHHGREVTKEERPVVYLKKITAKVPCPHCGGEMHYEEVHIDSDGFRGHVDGILEFVVDGVIIHVVIDFKGTNAAKIKRDNPQRPEYPDQKHVKQISIYTYALSQYEGLNVVAWALLYTARDNPFEQKLIPHLMSDSDWDDAKELHDSQVKQVRILYKSLDDGNIQRILKHKLCPDHKFYRKKVDSRYHECEFADMCFSAPRQMMDLLKDAKRNLTVNKK